MTNVPITTEADNAEHRQMPARVEHAFARTKAYKILRDCRQRGFGLHRAAPAGEQFEWAVRLSPRGRYAVVLDGGAASELRGAGRMMTV